MKSVRYIVILVLWSLFYHYRLLYVHLYFWPHIFISNSKNIIFGVGLTQFVKYVFDVFWFKIYIFWALHHADLKYFEFQVWRRRAIFTFLSKYLRRQFWKRVISMIWQYCLIYCTKDIIPRCSFWTIWLLKSTILRFQLNTTWCVWEYTGILGVIQSVSLLKKDSMYQNLWLNLLFLKSLQPSIWFDETGVKYKF